MTGPRAWTAPAMVAIVPVAAVAVLLVAAPTRGGESPTRRVTLHFYGPAGHREAVVVAMPAWYGPRRNPALPLVISPHGRGGSAAGNARRWGDLPARLGLIVLDAGLSGRRLQRESWAWPPEIDELARLPEIVRRRLPYLRFDPRRVYAAGDSMGGQEALMLLARHPHLLAAVATADPVTNFLERQRQFPRSADSRGEQRRARLEVGASPARAPWLYLCRSPSAYAATIAFAGVPTRLWWSRRDRVVIDQQRTQAGELFKTVNHLNPQAPISERITQDRHGWIFWSDHGLPEIARWLLQHRRPETQARADDLRIEGVHPARASPASPRGGIGVFIPPERRLRVRAEASTDRMIGRTSRGSVARAWIRTPRSPERAMPGFTGRGDDWASTSQPTKGGLL